MALMVSKVNCHKRGHRTSRRGRGASRARARQGGGRTDTGRGKTGVTTTKTKTTCLQIREYENTRTREYENANANIANANTNTNLRIYDRLPWLNLAHQLNPAMLPCCHTATLHACCSAINSARNNTIGPTHTAGTHFCRTTPNRPMNRPMSCPLAALASFIGT